MSSKNMGEQQGKPDYSILFEDFPHSNPYMISLLRQGDYRGLLSLCVTEVGWEEVHRARLYGIQKYDRFNWAESIGTKDHNSFMDANKRSLYRHLAAYHSGEMIDNDSHLHHLTMVALRCMIAIEYNERQGTVEVSSVHKDAHQGGSTPPRSPY